MHTSRSSGAPTQRENCASLRTQDRAHFHEQQARQRERVRRINFVASDCRTVTAIGGYWRVAILPTLSNQRADQQWNETISEIDISSGAGGAAASGKRQNETCWGLATFKYKIENYDWWADGSWVSPRRVFIFLKYSQHSVGSTEHYDDLLLLGAT